MISVLIEIRRLDPHLVDLYFERRDEAFDDAIAILMKEKWRWKRYEFQLRGVRHVHGIYNNIDFDGKNIDILKVLNKIVSTFRTHAAILYYSS